MALQRRQLNVIREMDEEVQETSVEEEKQKTLEKIVKIQKLLKKYVIEKRSGLCSKEKAGRIAYTVSLLEDAVAKLENKIEFIGNIHKNRKSYLNQNQTLSGRNNHNFTQFLNSVHYNSQNLFSKRDGMDNITNETCNETLGLYHDKAKGICDDGVSVFCMQDPDVNFNRINDGRLFQEKIKDIHSLLQMLKGD